MLNSLYVKLIQIKNVLEKMERKFFAFRDSGIFQKIIQFFNAE